MSAKLIEEINKLHAEFKSAVERSDNAATERLNTAIDAIEAKLKEVEKASNRPAVQSVNEDAELKSYREYARGAISATEYKSMTATGGTNGSEGGVTVPKVIDSAILTSLVDISPIRSIARVVSVPTTDFNLPFSPAGAASGWVGEAATRSATTTPTFANIKPTFGELYANPQITQQLLDDSQFDLTSFLAGSVSTEFARAEGAAFVSGDGTNKPTGFLAGTINSTDDSTRALGAIQYVASGQAAALPTNASAFDTFISIVHSLKAGYRTGAVWVMSKAVIGKLRAYKDSNGQYLWQPSLVAAVPSTFLGYPVVEAEDMPAVAANAFPIAFGNFNAGYVIADRIGTRTIVDNLTNKPYVGFYTTKRVGGCVVDSAAIKVMKIAAS